MAGNAHRRRHGNQPGCIYCKERPKVARRLHLYRNKNGHRHNPTAKKRGKRPKKG
jgi:hypothetical protein